MLEARDRVGGRTLNHKVQKGVIAELGGEYVGPTQDRVLALAKAVGVETFKTYNEGNNVLLSRAAQLALPRHPGLSDDPGFNEFTVKSASGSTRWRRRSRSTRPGRPKRAAEWDAMTLGQWGDQTFTTEGAKRLLAIATEPLWGVEPREVSLLYALWYIASAGNEKTPGSFRGCSPHPAARRKAASSAARRASRSGGERLGSGRAGRAGAPHRAGPRPRAGDLRPHDRRGARGDRGRAARARLADPLRARPAGDPPQAAQGNRARQPDQVGGGLRQAVLARPGPQRPGRLGDRARPTPRSTTRRRRAAGDPVRLHRRRPGAPLRQALALRAAQGGARRTSSPISARRRAGRRTRSRWTGPRRRGRAGARSATPA